MFFLLRNFADVLITPYLPHPTDFTIGSDLARIVFYRKQIVHSQHKISNTDFEIAWKDITGVSFIFKVLEFYPDDNISALKHYVFHDRMCMLIL